MNCWSIFDSISSIALDQLSREKRGKEKITHLPTQINDILSRLLQKHTLSMINMIWINDQIWNQCRFRYCLHGRVQMQCQEWNYGSEIGKCLVGQKVIWSCTKWRMIQWLSIEDIFGERERKKYCWGDDFVEKINVLMSLIEKNNIIIMIK